jgi:hypothetical protein
LEIGQIFPRLGLLGGDMLRVIGEVSECLIVLSQLEGSFKGCQLVLEVRAENTQMSRLAKEQLCVEVAQ